MDIVYIWKQKKYKQTKNKWETEKFTSQFTYYLGIPWIIYKTRWATPKKKWNLRCYGVQALKQVITIDKDVVLQHS